MARLKQRGPYRTDQRQAIARLERRRQALGVSLEDLAARSGVRLRRLYRIRADHHAFPRDIKALTYALRTIERERAVEQEAMGS
uniref:hypothetical protein n=1 Tax=Stappia sp. TaxID=1870903 RepID=UPI003BABEF20